MTLIYGKSRNPVLHSLNLEIDSGQVLPILGGNGTGKTTLLKALSGLLRPHLGRILIDDSDLYQKRGSALQRLSSSLYSERSFYYRLSARENLRYFLSLRGIYGRTAMSSIDMALDRFDLLGLQDIPFMHLSLGQRKRLGLARALAAPASLYILDEPTANLDAKSCRLVYQAMTDKSADGASILFSTHNVADLATSTGNVIYLKNGNATRVHLETRDSITARKRFRIVGSLDPESIASIPEVSCVISQSEVEVDIPVGKSLGSVLQSFERIGIEVNEVIDDRSR
ncbi:heme ABC exporter ATP-binding protein CcmA [Bifidobacterium longum subsp. infantis]|uniref:heme ABC exporter ATP-binding protein CcmA n=1 Tax=Bifidobacterium longum TaxID=216816 RepID=UPI001E307234|nr:heme ABC exporter ATP-binding protein CcmA [Bifidobacterium longum]UPT07147.1 heme ABC exporter ATP-binding protein CcmA [Bifidobacterium longum subsp. infantis]